MPPYKRYVQKQKKRRGTQETSWSKKQRCRSASSLSSRLKNLKNSGIIFETFFRTFQMSIAQKKRQCKIFVQLLLCSLAIYNVRNIRKLVVRELILQHLGRCLEGMITNDTTKNRMINNVSTTALLPDISRRQTKINQSQIGQRNFGSNEQ